MAERTTAAQAAGVKTTEAAPEGQAAPTAREDEKSLRTRLEAVERQRDEYLGLLQRTKADFENYQKRFQRDLADERRFAHVPLARELLPVVDNLQRALHAARVQGETGALAQGVALIESQLLELLDRFSITPIDALDQAFDPNLHEGVRQQPRADVAAGTVVEVPEPGYRVHDRVLRPARVVVATPEGRDASFNEPTAGRGPGASSAER